MAKKQDKDAVHDDEVLEDGGTRVYELGFHLDPDLPSEEVKKAYQAVRTVVTARGTLVAEGEPQKMQLAYTISRSDTAGRRDFDAAYFSWLAYETSTEGHDEVLAAAKADTRIIRFIDVLTTKEAARHAAEVTVLAAKGTEHEEDTASAPAADELDTAIENAAV